MKRPKIEEYPKPMIAEEAENAQIVSSKLLAEIKEGFRLANAGLTNAFCAAKKLGFADTCLGIAETKKDVADAYIKISDFINNGQP